MLSTVAYYNECAQNSSSGSNDKKDCQEWMKNEANQLKRGINKTAVPPETIDFCLQYLV